MRMVKYTHSCVRLEDGDRALVIDPGSFSEDEPLDEASAVLITHEHPDHLDVDKLARRPNLEIWTNAAVAAKLNAAGLREGRGGGPGINVVAAGSTFTAAGFSVEVYGERHEVIHPDLPPVPNIGFFVDGTFFHPGDAFTDPGRPVGTLVVPISAPWLRGSDSVDYVRRLRPSLALAGHDGLLNDIGLTVYDGLLSSLCEASGLDYRRVTPGTTVDLPS